jgi:hypothetical protein
MTFSPKDVSPKNAITKFSFNSSRLRADDFFVPVLILMLKIELSALVPTYLLQAYF